MRQRVETKCLMARPMHCWMNMDTSHNLYAHSFILFWVFYLSDRAYKDRLLHIVYPKRVKCLKGRSFNTTT